MRVVRALIAHDPFDDNDNDNDNDKDNAKGADDVLLLLNVVEDNDSDSNTKPSKASPNHNKPIEESVEPKTSALDVELEEDEMLLLKKQAQQNEKNKIKRSKILFLCYWNAGT